MPAFKYQQGDRPLDGYTIEYGLGRGGFGEVYFAISDAGRHVAIKAVQNYQDIELRGIRHCMNLKSPHLVSIFDLKFNEQGEPFVIMEYVSGSSLRTLLDESPDGLGETKSAFFLQEMSKGLTYLHDQGIVHRDLKPHNVFYEDGFVKIGDYSLSKALTASHRSGHTVTVGTVHYMAPEISMGRYDTRVDIYALGIILYEMLTGQPPFTGQTMGEVLMKHMNGEVDLSKIQEPFADALRKALAKDPEKRFASAAEMTAAVFGAQHVQDSVAEFNPQHLSLVAARVGAKVRAATAATLAPADTSGHAAVSTQKDPPIRRTEEPVPSIAFLAGRSVGLFAKHTGLMSLGRLRFTDAEDDILKPPQRFAFALLCLLAVSIGCGLLTQNVFAWPGEHASAGQVGVWAFGAIAGGTIALLLTGRWAGPTLAHESGLVSRLILVTTCWVGGWLGLVAVAPLSELIGTAFPRSPRLQALMWSSFVPLLLVDIRQLLAVSRRKRIALGPALLAGIPAAFLAGSWSGDPVLSLGIAAGILLSMQVASPFVGRFEPPRQTVSPATSASEPPRPELSPAVRREEPSPPFSAATAAPQSLLTERTPSGGSSRNRTIALILATGPAFSGICGLQRFYVGKVWTGLLYLITAGLFGIGQLVDVVLIVSGQFLDDGERPVVHWEGQSTAGESSASPVNAWSSIPPRGSWGTLLANVLGILLLIATCGVGLFTVARIPEAIAAWEASDLVHTTFARDLEQVLGTGNWQRIISRLGAIATVSLFLSGVTVLLLARRSAGHWHLVRAVFGSLCCLATVGLFAVPFSQVTWSAPANLIAQNRMGDALESIVTDRFLVMYALAGVALLAGLFCLCWPAARVADPPTTTAQAKEIVR